MNLFEPDTPLDEASVQDGKAQLHKRIATTVYVTQARLHISAVKDAILAG